MKGRKVMRIVNKNIVINKSIYEQVNIFILNEYINRINKNTHDYKVLTTEKQYKIIVTPKIERA